MLFKYLTALRQHGLLVVLLFCCNFAAFYAVSAASDNNGNAKPSVLADVQRLSDKTMQGRQTNTEGSAVAQAYIAARYADIGLAKFTNSYYAPFTYQRGWSDKTGTNMQAWISGCKYPDQYIVISAHYDHLGRSGSKIYYGADDNASGVAAMLALAQRFKISCPAYSYIFLATDAEETGLYGSKAFLQQAPVPVSNIIFNLNLDMVSRADRQGRLYVTGARQFPELKQYLKDVEQGASIRFLHNRGPEKFTNLTRNNNWLMASDHGAFHRQGISYIFIGGQEHDQYHTVDDKWQNIEPHFLQKVMQTIYATAYWLDQQRPEQLKH
ncbi:M28 family peptidase [Rheinheimera sp. WS51]|uniref:M28 family peptidase n=1 Tax=Rheinheimera sp. WS51 TaxID=3425886 RepID=UPI003D8C33D7